MSVHLTRMSFVLLTLLGVGVSACSGPEPEYGTDGACGSNNSPLANELHSP